MRILIFTFILAISCQICFAQHNLKHDSLELVLINAKSDTSRVLIYEEQMIMANNRKKKIEFGLLGFNLAKKINYNRGIISCGNKVAYMMSHSDFYKAIPILLETKKIAESTNDKFELAYALGILGYAYGKFDNQKAFSYYLQAKNLMDKEGFSEDKLNISLLLGMWYKENSNRLDSALYYLNKSLQQALNSTTYYYNAKKHLRHFGAVYYKLGKKDTAMMYFRQAIEQINDSRSDSYQYISYIFRDTNQLDSAIFYAEKSFELVKNSSSELLILEPATLLFELYKDKNPSKALKYHIIASSARDSIYNQENARYIDKLAFEIHERKVELQRKNEANQVAYQNRLRTNAILGITFTLLVIAIFLFISKRRKQKEKQKIEKAYDLLKSTQSQLIQSEKMASLGELTAGIAHEIQNPLNFVNNFSEVSKELIDEMNEELTKGDINEAKEIGKDIDNNLEKINHHGKRAEAIVKGMLQHSRTSAGEKELTDMNALADEFLRLSYHGLRAKDKSFNADFKTELDDSLPKLNIVPQDIGRVLLNLINNAFYAAPLPPEGGFKDPDYKHKPLVIVSTSYLPPSGEMKGAVLISVSDNGSGIPPEIKDKIFQPFFTTKPTGSGTGLGLSLSYDIVKAHGGEIKVESTENSGTKFIIEIPLKSK